MIEQLKDKNGNITGTKETLYGSNGVIIKEIIRNLDGNPTKEITYDKFLNIIIYKVIKYNKNGKRIEEKNSYPNRSRDNFEIIKYKYDKTGGCSVSKTISETPIMKIPDELVRKEILLDDSGERIGKKEYMFERNGFGYKQVERYSTLTKTTIYNKDKNVALIENYNHYWCTEIEEIYPLEPEKNKKVTYKDLLNCGCN